MFGTVGIAHIFQMPDMCRIIAVMSHIPAWDKSRWWLSGWAWKDFYLIRFIYAVLKADRISVSPISAARADARFISS